jgi:hypothetical protein
MVPFPRCLPPALLALFLTACGPRQEPAAAAPADQFWDFGLIPHGKASQHDFVVDIRALGKELVPLGVSADCSCARSQLWLRDPQGHEREATGQPNPQFAAKPGEQLVVRLLVDTVHKEAVDQPVAESRAKLILQPATATAAETRVYVPLRFRFGIDSPVKLQPFSLLDFGRVPLSQSPTLQTTIRSDIEGRKIAFGSATSSDPALAVSLETETDGVTLHVRFTPLPHSTPAPFKAVITVATDLPDGYQVRIPVAGETVPDLEAVPMNKVSLGAFDFNQEQGPEQFVIAADHDRSRPAAFTVVRLLDREGHDASSHFAVRLEPVPGDERSTRVVVRYVGGLAPPVFRGELLLAKDKDAGPFLPIELVAFHTKTP